MYFDQVGQADLRRIKVDQHRFRQAVVRWLRTDKTLRDVRHSTQILKNGLGAPVTTATETYTLLLQKQLLQKMNPLTRSTFG